MQSFARDTKSDEMEEQRKVEEKRKGALLIILAGACWGSISIYINYLDAAGLSTMQISFLRQLFSSIVFAIVLSLHDRSKFRIPIRDLGLINGVLFASDDIDLIFLPGLTADYRLFEKQLFE